VALFEIGQERGKVARLRDHRSRGCAKADAELARHDLCERGLAKSRGAHEQHVVQGLDAFSRGFNKDGEIRARLRLADQVRQQLRARRSVAVIVAAALGRHDAGGRVHSEPRLYLFGSNSPMLTTLGSRPLSGTMTRALAS